MEFTIEIVSEYGYHTLYLDGKEIKTLQNIKVIKNMAAALKSNLEIQGYKVNEC